MKEKTNQSEVLTNENAALEQVVTENNEQCTVLPMEDGLMGHYITLMNSYENGTTTCANLIAIPNGDYVPGHEKTYMLIPKKRRADRPVEIFLAKFDGGFGSNCEIIRF